MPRPDAPPLTRGVVLRGIGFAAAIVLGAVAVWLIVTSTTQKRIEIGVLTGLWGLLLGAYSMFGTRRHLNDSEPQPRPSGEVALRDSDELERPEDTDARRDWETRLEQLLRREINATMNREVAALRGEIAQLRQDLLEKVGGQLRLERIETTRLIGSDLEALQHEVRQLKVASETGPAVNELLGRMAAPRGTFRPVVEPARVRPVSRPTAEVEAGVLAARVDDRTESLVEANERPVIRPDAPAPRPEAAAQDAVATRGAEVARAKAARVEAARVEAARVEAARVEAARVEAARVEAAQAEAERVEAERKEAKRVAAERKEAERVEARRAEARQAEAERAKAKHVAEQRAAAVRAGATAGAPATSVRPTPPRSFGDQRVEVPRSEPEPAHSPSSRARDPFVSLPRIRPFTDFALDPIESADADAATVSPDRAGETGTPTTNGTSRGYTGRRRRSGDDTDEAGDPGRHSRHAEPDQDTRGGHRRRPEEQENGEDLLARLLGRESAEQ
ncbi:MAG: DUF6779 domain-containing protein [Jatrophihabitans sp.]